MSKSNSSRKSSVYLEEDGPNSDYEPSAVSSISESDHEIDKDLTIYNNECYVVSDKWLENGDDVEWGEINKFKKEERVSSKSSNERGKYASLLSRLSLKTSELRGGKIEGSLSKPKALPVSKEDKKNVLFKIEI